MFSIRSLITIGVSTAISATLTVAAAQPNVRARVRQVWLEAQSSLEAAADTLAAQAGADASGQAGATGDDLLPPGVTIVTETQAGADASVTTDPPLAVDTTITTGADTSLSAEAGAISLEAGGQVAVDQQAQLDAGKVLDVNADAAAAAGGEAALGSQLIKGLKGTITGLAGGFVTTSTKTEAGP